LLAEVCLKSVDYEAGVLVEVKSIDLPIEPAVAALQSDGQLFYLLGLLGLLPFLVGPSEGSVVLERVTLVVVILQPDSLALAKQRVVSRSLIRADELN